jgi:hypothetical protein
MSRATITEEPIAPIIDADAVQNAALAEQQPMKMIYDRDITWARGNSIGVCAFAGRGSESNSFMLNPRFDMGSANYHLSIEEARAMRDALTEAIAAWEKVMGAL